VGGEKGLRNGGREERGESECVCERESKRERERARASVFLCLS